MTKIVLNIYASYRIDISEIVSGTQKLTSDLDNLDQDNAEAVYRDIENNNWWVYVMHDLHGLGKCIFNLILLNSYNQYKTLCAVSIIYISCYIFSFMYVYLYMCDLVLIKGCRTFSHLCAKF